MSKSNELRYIYPIPDGILLFIKGKFTMGKLKLSLLSYTVVQKIPSLTEIPMSKYETVSPLSVVFLSINSDGYILFISFSKEGLLIVNKSSMYLNMLHKCLALDMLFFSKAYTQN